MKKTLLCGVMALGLIFTGCSSEEPLVPDVNKPLERDQTFYINMSINGDAVSGSRTSESNGSPDAEGDFQAGSDEENAVNNAYFVFYDDEGRVVGNIVPIDINSMDPVTNVVGATVEKSYQSVVAVDVKKGESTPTQVICYINPISPSTLGVDLNIIQTVNRPNVTTNVGNKTYMAMSNSVYYPNNVDGNIEPQIAVPIPETARHTSEAAAEDALKSFQSQTNPDPNDPHVVNIYVERYATKLQFNVENRTDYKTCTRIFDTTNDDSQKTTTNNVVLSFVPEFWAVNAEATTSYVIKSYRKEADGGGALPDNYTYQYLNSRINPVYTGTPPSGLDYADENERLTTDKSWAWNNPTYKRSYWGMSPAYFQKEYPEVSSDLDNITDIHQKYISYAELKDPNSDYGYPADDKNPHYFKETTVGRWALVAANPNAAVASVIYVGHYELTVNGKSVGSPGFYTYMSGPVPDVEEDRPYIYFENETGQVTSKVAGGESMLMRFLAQQTIIFKKVTNEQTGKDEFIRYNYRNKADREAMTAFLAVSEVSKDVKIAYDGDKTTELKLQNNTRTLQFTQPNLENVYILTAEGYKTIVADNATVENSQIRITDANVTLMRQVGYCYYYLKGEAYFSIPVKHLGWYRKGNYNLYDSSGKKLEEETLDWNIVRVGDFGMVRNHSYSINVENILGLGTGIGDENNPIVPPSNTKNYYIAYSVNILKWAVVPTQHTKL